MPFEKGRSGNPNGRKKSVPNKSTTELRTMLTAAFEGEISSIPDTLKKLEPKERLEILAKFINHIIPKVQPERDIEPEFEHAEAIRHMVNTTMRPPDVTFVAKDFSKPPDV